MKHPRLRATRTLFALYLCAAFLAAMVSVPFAVSHVALAGAIASGVSAGASQAR